MKPGTFTQFELMLLLGLVIMLVFLFIIVTFSWVHQKKKGKEEKRQFASQRDYQGKLNEIRIHHEEKERFRFSSDLQKEINELQNSIQKTNQILDQSQDLEFRKYLTEHLEKLSQIKQNIESISQQIAPATLLETGLSNALESMISQLNGLGKADLFLMEKNYKQQDELIEIMLFRIADEIICNALKHGKPNRIDLFLSGNDEQIVLEIRDNGLPFNLQQKLSENNISSPGNGLKNIANRLQHNAELTYMHQEGTNRNRIIANHTLN